MFQCGKNDRHFAKGQEARNVRVWNVSVLDCAVYDSELWQAKDNNSGLGQVSAYTNVDARNVARSCR